MQPLYGVEVRFTWFGGDRHETSVADRVYGAIRVQAMGEGASVCHIVNSANSLC